MPRLCLCSGNVPTSEPTASIWLHPIHPYRTFIVWIIRLRSQSDPKARLGAEWYCGHGCKGLLMKTFPNDVRLIREFRIQIWEVLIVDFFGEKTH